jgi:hypothetical protein
MLRFLQLMVYLVVNQISMMMYCPATSTPAMTRSCQGSFVRPAARAAAAALLQAPVWDEGFSSQRLNPPRRLI